MPHARPVVLVTGAARRIGAAIARRLHACGHDLALHHHRSVDEAAALAAELDALGGGRTLLLQADLADPGQPQALVSACVEHFGRLDALVNNASLFHPTPLDLATPAQWQAMMWTNAGAPFFLARAAAPHLRAAGGAVVNLADLYAHRPLRDHALYSAGKAALVSLTRALAQELAPRVRVNAVAPGAILWPEQAADPQQAQARQNAILQATALGRTGAPDDIAAAVHWLLSDQAGYVTGQVLHVDGGRGR